MRILYELLKNFKLIFRNWSSLVLIVLAPLLLILIVGYSFSGDSLHDVKLGIIAENFDVTQLAKNISEFGDVHEYTKLENCLIDMTLAKNHICIKIKGSGDEEYPTSDVTFYYDNTRKKSTLLILSNIKEFFGLTSEKISLISTQTIIDNIQNLLNFINQRIDDIEDVKNEAEKIKSDLILRKQKLIELNDKFEPKYLSIKKVYSTLTPYVESLDESLITLESEMDYLLILSNDLLDIKVPEYNLTNKINITNNITTDINTSIINITKESISKKISNYSVNVLKNQILSVKNQSNHTQEELSSIMNQSSEIILELDNMNRMIKEEINRSDQYIALINESITKLEIIVNQAKEKMQDLSKIDPTLASKIVKPITQNFEELISDLKDIQITFPALLSTILMFVSLLFSNIITQLEISNKAFIRNILTPANDILFTAGLVLTNFIIIGFQVTVLLLVAQAKFSIDIMGNLANLIPLLSVLILMFVFLGMIIAYINKNIQTSILMSTFIALGFFLFSDVVNALEAMPVFASKIASLSPIVISNGILRKILFFDIGLGSEFQILVAYMIFTGIVLFIVSKKKNKERF